MNSLPVINRDSVPEPSATAQVAIMVTRRCNMTCAHCSVESNPRVKGQPEEEELLRWVQQAAAANVSSILFTGGEPMIREAVVLRLMQAASKLGLKSSMTTNGFWGKTAEGAQRRLAALRKAGLQRLSVSYDRYHAEFMGPEPVLNIARAAADTGFPINIGITRVAIDNDLEEIIAPFRELDGVYLRFYDVQPLGSARNLKPDSLRSEIEGFCSACSSPAITDDGRMTACNGPSYFLKSPSPLAIGSLDESSVSQLLKRHEQDPVLDTIRTFGPGRLRDELKTISGFEEFAVRDHYHGMCDLCQHLTGDPGAVEALRERLSQPQHVAQRLAMKRVMDESRQSGPLNRRYVNSLGSRRAMFRATAAEKTPWPAESQRVLGRADLDWNELAKYLSACGLVRPLLSALDDPQIRRWAPTFFLRDVQKRALTDGVRELIGKEILRRLSVVLTEIGTNGVLLKGAAVLALNEVPETGSDERRTSEVVRSSGDVDIYVHPRFAIELRSRLLQSGFVGEQKHEQPLQSHHHLAPVSFQNVPVEIHTRIAPAVWNLPEDEMLERAVPLPSDKLKGLSTLDAEGMLLHTVVHVAHHRFALGIKTAWDVRWLVREFPRMEWERIASWADASGVRRAFWVPMHVMCRDLKIDVPADFLLGRPTDSRQRKLELIAARRLYSLDGIRKDANHAKGVAIILLMHDSWSGCLMHGSLIASRFAREAVRTPFASSKKILRFLRQSIQQVRRLRQAMVSARLQPDQPAE